MATSTAHTTIHPGDVTTMPQLPRKESLGISRHGRRQRERMKLAFIRLRKPTESIYRGIPHSGSSRPRTRKVVPFSDRARAAPVTERVPWLFGLREMDRVGTERPRTSVANDCVPSSSSSAFLRKIAESLVDVRVVAMNFSLSLFDRLRPRNGYFRHGMDKRTPRGW